MKSFPFPLLFILPFAFPAAAQKPGAPKHPPDVAAAAPRLLSDAEVPLASLPDAVILGCVHAGDRPHGPDTDTLADVRRATAGREFDGAPRSVVVTVGFTVPGAEQPLLAFLSDRTEANLCLLRRTGGAIALASAPGETVGAGDPVNPGFTGWLAAAGGQYFLLDTRKTTGDSAGLECLRLYRLDAATGALALSDSACEQAGSWSSGKLPGGGTFYKGSDYIPTLHEWTSQCVTRDGAGVPKPGVDHATLGSLTPEVFCAGKPRLSDSYYEIQAGKLHIYRTVNPQDE